jgi:hypothetical protein
VPIELPKLDGRGYQDLLDEALSRIAQHNPEWTNFNESDPGVTLVELFAFLTESLLYRSALIPERNRKKFLQLLDMPLRPAVPARGLVVFANDRGGLQTLTLRDGTDVRAGPVPFQIERGLDVLPVEAQVFYKQEIKQADERLLDHYLGLYVTHPEKTPAKKLRLYRTLPFLPRASPLDLQSETLDASLWIALMARPLDMQSPGAGAVEHAREEVAGKTLSLGMVRALPATGTTILPHGLSSPSLEEGQVKVFLARGAGAGTSLADLALPVGAAGDGTRTPVILEVTLPSKGAMAAWKPPAPQDAGVGDSPPALDRGQSDRLIAWLRMRAASPSSLRLLWVGINAAMVTQRARVRGELLPDGTGEPDQEATLSRAPVLPGSVSVSVTTWKSDSAATERWKLIDDLGAALPEVPRPDSSSPSWRMSRSQGITSGRAPDRVNVFTVDPEAGRITFGDGARGARPPLGAQLRADYDACLGRAGNVLASTITQSTSLPAGWKVVNPLPTWGGCDAETVQEGERRIAQHLRHQERLVTAEDFESIAMRTPGADIGRVEVLAAYHPALGETPGVVTLLVIPGHDRQNPNAPEPDAAFLDAVSRWLEPRRLVTTVIIVRGPAYVPLSVSVGFEPSPGVSPAQVREAIAESIRSALSPLPAREAVGAGVNPELRRGWPLGKPVSAPELLAIASRAPGVRLVNRVALRDENKQESVDSIELAGLQLPKLVRIHVEIGEPPPFVDRGPKGEGGGEGALWLPVPVVPEEC